MPSLLPIFSLRIPEELLDEIKQIKTVAQRIRKLNMH